MIRSLNSVFAGVLLIAAVALSACSNGSSSNGGAGAPTQSPILASTATPTSTATPIPTTTATSAPTPSPGPTPIACNSGNQYTFVNNNSYPVWLAELYQGGGSISSNVIAPPGNNWKITPGKSVALCMPTGWSGRFWARTECDFTTPFANDPEYKSCSSTSDCTSGHTCFGGKCLLDCASGGTSFCQGTGGLNNVNAICFGADFITPPSGTPTPTVQVCTYPQGTLCKTGDCAGLYQCNGEWDGKTAAYGSGGPTSLFEPTSNSMTDVNYDASLVSGYNTQIEIVPSAGTCYAPSCTSDLNASCPANLQVTEAPTAMAGPIPCGNGTFCQSGVCQNNTCVIGCNDPGDQCTSSNPPAGLLCSDAVPNGDGSTYADMYLAKNFSGKVTSGPGVTMSSGNQGTATCWGNVDCLPNETCEMNPVANFPSGVGICSASGTFQPQTNCASQADVGKACGGYSAGYPNALGYVCVSVGSGNSDVACVPGYNPPVTGLGMLESPAGQTQLFTGEGAPINPEWLTAAKQAGGGTPWYETFAAACPHLYGWQYDDHAGGFDCNTNGGAAVDMTITFGAPTPSPTP